MFHPILKRKFEYFTNYFDAALKSEQTGRRNFAQSIVLYGQDSIAQYYLATEIARQLNCQKDGAYDCDCINCNWIRNNQHPAVLTISKNDNKPSDDTSSKVISIKQTLAINSSLVNTSDYYRVFIFCDSELEPPSEAQQKHLSEFEGLHFKFPQENWQPLPLNRDVLIEASANSLLKSIEEPPERTLFLFLTEDKEDIIETIISRSQCFYVPPASSYNNAGCDCEFLNSIFADYPAIKKVNVFNLVEQLESVMQEKGLKLEQVLDCMEFYLVEMIKRNINTGSAGSKVLIQKIKQDMLKLQHAKKQAQAYIKPQLVLGDLLFSFTE